MLKMLKEKVKPPEAINSAGLSFFLNPYSYLQLRKQKKILARADNIFIDGQWLCHFLRWFNIINIERCSFDNSSGAPLVFSHAVKHNLSVAVIGSTTNSINDFSIYLKEAYPQINLTYIRNGYFDNDSEIQSCHLELINSNVDIVIIGMGAPKQENFLISLKDLGWEGTGYTCGGFLHQTASKGHDYYPEFFNKLNLRFIYRIWDEPKLLKRYTVDYCHFVIVYLFDVMNKKFKGSDRGE